MSKITIEKVKHEDKVSANGKNYTRCSILTTNTKGEETWLSGFGNNTTKSYTKGQTVELTITTSVGKDGKTYYNFEEPAERNVFTELDEIKALLRQVLEKTNQTSSDGFKPPYTVKSSPTTITEEELDKIKDIFGEDPGENHP